MRKTGKQKNKKREKCIYIYICKYLAIHESMMYQFFSCWFIDHLRKGERAREKKMEITNFLFFSSTYTMTSFLIISRTSSLLEWFLCIPLFFADSLSLSLFLSLKLPQTPIYKQERKHAHRHPPHTQERDLPYILQERMWRLVTRID